MYRSAQLRNWSWGFFFTVTVSDIVLACLVDNPANVDKKLCKRWDYVVGTKYWYRPLNLGYPEPKVRGVGGGRNWRPTIPILSIKQVISVHFCLSRLKRWSSDRIIIPQLCGTSSPSFSMQFVSDLYNFLGFRSYLIIKFFNLKNKIKNS